MSTAAIILQERGEPVLGREDQAQCGDSGVHPKPKIKPEARARLKSRGHHGGKPQDGNWGKRLHEGEFQDPRAWKAGSPEC